jgi:hypothetical protein
LEIDFDVKAEEVIDRLAKKGIRCQAQQIYQIRSLLRKSKPKTMTPITRRKVEKAFPHGRCLLSLEQCILTALSGHSDGLSDRDLSDAVKKVGYGNLVLRKNDSDFFNVVQKKLHEMVKDGHVAKNGSQYLLQGKDEEALGSIDELRPKLQGLNLLPSHQKEILEKLKKIDDETKRLVSEHQLLREAVIRLAKQKGFDNPEGLPDTLIRVHREFTQLERRLEEEYSSLFSSK